MSGAEYRNITMHSNISLEETNYDEIDEDIFITIL